MDKESSDISDFPGKDQVQDPVLELRHEIEIEAQPQLIWPWIIQLGYHRGGWYIDTWWDKVIQEYFWPRVVPPNARGIYKPPAMEILPQYQNLTKGDIIPDGPPGTAYYEVIDIEVNRLLLLYATSHFNYVAPQFIYKTRFAPKGAFCWAFILQKLDERSSKLTSWWQAEIQPRRFFFLFKPFFSLVDRLHQRDILRGVKRRVEKKPAKIG